MNCNQNNFNIRKEKILSTLEFVYNNDCPWYRNVWKDTNSLGIDSDLSYSDFTSLPLISKQNFLASNSPDDYTFLPQTEIISYRSTSGTTNAGIFCFPRAVYTPDIRTIISNAGGTRFAYLGAAEKGASTVLDYALMDIFAISADPKAPNFSAEKIVTNAIDTLIATPSVLFSLASELQKMHYESEILYIHTYGEMFSQFILDKIQALYPNAQVFREYALGESGQGIGYSTHKCNLPPNGYHAYREAFTEIISSEIVITTLGPNNPMPLVRYRTGDEAQHINHACACGDNNFESFELLGRKNVDFVRIGGYEIRYESLRIALSYLSPDYTKSIKDFYATVTPQKETAQLKITIAVNDNNHNLISNIEFEKQVQKILTEKTKVSQNKTIRDMIHEHKLLPPTVTIVKDTGKIDIKKTGISLL